MHPGPLRGTGRGGQQGSVIMNATSEINRSKEQHELYTWLNNYLNPTQKPTHEWHKPSISDLTPTPEWVNPFSTKKEPSCSTMPKQCNQSSSTPRKK